MLKKLLITISILFISTLQTLAADISTEKCTLCLYKDGEAVKIEKDYGEIQPILEKIIHDTYDINLNVLMSDRSVNDMKNVGEHLEITLKTPRLYKSKNSHMTYLGYKTYVVKENNEVHRLPATKIFMTLQQKPLAGGIGSTEFNPKIINIDQRRIRVIFGDRNGYCSVPEFAFGVDGDFQKLLDMFNTETREKAVLED